MFKCQFLCLFIGCSLATLWNYSQLLYLDLGSCSASLFTDVSDLYNRPNGVLFKAYFISCDIKSLTFALDKPRKLLHMPFPQIDDRTS